jgi:hypothetical protein
MYILLVGDQGIRKSYAKDQSRDLIEEAFPDYPIGADITTRDDLVKFMSADITERAYVDVDGTSNTYHPLALFINEFKHFLSYNPVSMLSFIVDIFDRTDRIWRASTIKRGQEEIVRPYLNILACENTDWLISRLKDGIITGGLSRRFVVIYENSESEVAIPRPFLPPNAKQIWDRMKAHLQGIQGQAREYKWGHGAEDYFDSWYRKNKASLPEDKILRGFMRTKDQMLLKTCIALDLAEYQPSYEISIDGLETTLALFANFEPNMPKLYASAGRNELAVHQNNLLDLIDQRGGIIAEKELLMLMNKEMNGFEQTQSLAFFLKTEQLFQRVFQWPDQTKAPRNWIITPKALGNERIRKAFLGQP